MNYVISIIAPERLEILTDLCEGLGLPLTVTLHGRGTAVQSMLDLLGIESNERRVVLTIADAENTAALIAAQKRRLHIGVPGHGIVIAVPIKSVGGGNTVAYLNGGRSPKYTPDLSCAYELIIAIANEGGTDAVMNAARAAGARSCTARGPAQRVRRNSTTSPSRRRRRSFLLSLRRGRRPRSCAPFCARQDRTVTRAPSSSRSRLRPWRASVCWRRIEQQHELGRGENAPA